MKCINNTGFVELYIIDNIFMHYSSDIVINWENSNYYISDNIIPYIIKW